MALEIMEGSNGVSLNGSGEIPPKDSPAGVYIQRKRVSPSDQGFPNTTSHFGQDKPSGNFFGQFDVQKKVNTSEDPAGPRVVKIVTKLWKWNNFHVQWTPGQIVFFIKDLDDKMYMDTSMTVSGMPPVTVVSAPQLMALFDKAAKKYSSDREVYELGIRGTGQLAIDDMDVKQKHSLVEIDGVSKRVSLLGVCYGNSQIDESLISMEVAVTGCSRCTNYWGEKARPGRYVGFIIERLKPFTVIDPLRNPLMVSPWIGEDGVSYPEKLDESEKIFYMVGIITWANPITGFSQQYNTPPTQSLLGMLGRFGTEIDTTRATTEYHDALGSVVVKLLPFSIKN